MAFYQRVLGIAVLGSVSLLSGCGSFFSCEGKTECPTTGTGGTTNSGDYVYVSNSESGSNYISGYTLSSGVLTAISGADVNLGFIPVAMVVAPSNGFLYVASNGGASNPGVYVYSINTSGALTEINNLNPLSLDSGISSMDLSPDGNYLFTLSTSTVGVVLNEYQMNKTTGLPTVDNPTTILTAGTLCAISGSPLSQPCTVKVSPNENYVAVALAGYGFEVFPYSSSGGVTSTTGVQLSPSPSAQSADFSLAFDKNNFLYVASTVALTSFGGLGGTAAPVQEKIVAYDAGVTPRSVTVASSSGFVYTANEGNSTISAFSLPGSGVMTSLGAPIVGPTSVSALGVDSTGKYMLAAGYNSTNGLQVFSIGTTGALTGVGTPQGTRADDTTVPVVMALSH